MTRVLILGAGYGTRLESDVQNYLKIYKPIDSVENNEENFENNNEKDLEIKQEIVHKNDYNLVQALAGKSKALLPLAGKPLVSHWLDLILKENICQLNEIFVVTNHVHYSQFVQWAEQNNIPKENIFDNQTISNETRNGAILDLKIMLDYMESTGNYTNDQELIVIGGDTLFDRGFSLKKVQDSSKYSALQILSYELHPSENITEKGIIELERITSDNSNNSDTEENSNIFHVKKFYEKPAKDVTDSRTASPCFYCIPRNAKSYIEQYLSFIKNHENYERLKDAPGFFIKNMVENVGNVTALPIEKRFDVGRLDQYFETHQYFSNSS